ncbi:MAG: hypothetical protein WCK89_14070 [bacterium]
MKAILRCILAVVLALVIKQSQGAELAVDTVIAIDVSWSMVMDLRKELKREGYNPDKLADLELAFKKKPELFEKNILYKTVRAIDAVIDQYETGNIAIITFREGVFDLDGAKSPLSGFFAADVSRADSSQKDRLKSFLDPYYPGNKRFPEAPGWTGVLFETIMRRGVENKTYIHKTCQQAFEYLQERARRPGYHDGTEMQRILLFTDGQEEEAGADFKLLLSRFRTYRESDIYFEYQEIFTGNPINEKPEDGEKREVRKFETRKSGFIYNEGNLERILYLFSMGGDMSASFKQPDEGAKADAIAAKVSPAIVLYGRNSLSTKPARGQVVLTLDAKGAIPGAKLMPDKVSLEAISSQYTSIPLTIELPADLAGDDAFWKIQERSAAIRADLQLEEKEIVPIIKRTEFPVALTFRARPPAIPKTPVVRIVTKDFKNDSDTTAAAAWYGHQAGRAGDICGSFATECSDAPEPVDLKVSLADSAGKGLVLDGDEPGRSREFTACSGSAQKRSFSLRIAQDWAAPKASARLAFQVVNPKGAVVEPREATVEVRVMTSKVSLSWLSGKGVKVPTPARLDFGAATTQTLDAVVKGTPAGNAFELSFPPDFCPESSVEVSLTGNVNSVLGLIRKGQTDTGSAASTIVTSASCGLTLAAKPGAEGGRREGELVFSPLEGARLNDKAEPLRIPVDITVLDPNIALAWLDRADKPHKKPVPMRDFGTLGVKSVVKGNYRAARLKDYDSFIVQFKAERQTTPPLFLRLKLPKGVTTHPLALASVDEDKVLTPVPPEPGGLSWALHEPGAFRLLIRPDAKPGRYEWDAEFVTGNPVYVLNAAHGASAHFRTSIGTGAIPLWPFVLLAIAGVIAAFWPKRFDGSRALDIEIATVVVGNEKVQTISALKPSEGKHILTENGLDKSYISIRDDPAKLVFTVEDLSGHEQQYTLRVYWCRPALPTRFDVDKKRCSVRIIRAQYPKGGKS